MRTGRVVVITGAAGGMGSAITDRFLAKRNARAIRRDEAPSHNARNLRPISCGARLGDGIFLLLRQGGK
jgi:NAD(P)-dependent dehydrogenase (short-subunit alcohol dehydrogenase family)